MGYSRAFLTQENLRMDVIEMTKKRNIITLLKEIRLKCNELELHNDAFFSSLFFCMSAKIVIFAAPSGIRDVQKKY